MKTRPLFPVRPLLRAAFFLLCLTFIPSMNAQVLDPGMNFTGTNNGFNAEVRSILQIPSGADAGKLIVVGNFTNYRGTAVNRVARLLTNGDLDGTFTPPGTGVINGQVNAVGLTSTGQLIIGGAFNNGTQDYLARLNADGTLDGTYTTPGILDNTVQALAVDGSDRTVVVGDFTAPYNRVARFTSAGALEAIGTFNPGTGFTGGFTAGAVAIDGTGRILVGGDFTTFNALARSRIARLTTAGADDGTTFGSGFNNRVTEIRLDGTNIYVGGDFTTFNGTARGRIARLVTAGTLDGAFVPTGTGFDAAVNSIAVETAGGRIVVGGGFATFGATARNNIARLNNTGAIDFRFNPGSGFDNSVTKLVVQSDGKLVVGGRFQNYNTTAPRGRIARFAYAASLDISGRIFSERTQNDGATTDILDLTLGPAAPTAPLDLEEWHTSIAIGGTLTLGTHFQIVSGTVPPGMTLTLTKMSTKTVRVSITGSATAHANINDVNNLGIRFLDAALNGNNAAGVENLNTDPTTGVQRVFVIDFRDPATAAYTGAMFNETFINNGAMTGTRTVTLTNAMFRSSLATGATFTLGAGNDFTVAGLPGGMGITVTKTGANTATFTLTGNAAAHAAVNSGNLIITWNDAAFEGILATNVTGVNGVMNTTTFLDPGTAAYSGTVFPEAVPPNTGTVTQTRTVTLTNDNWLNSIANGTVLTAGGTHYTLGGTAVPAGLTFRATKTSNTVVTLDFTGTAAAHANANDVAGITVNFANAVLESGNAAGVTGLNPGTLSIDFQDPTPSVVFSGTAFNEDAPTDNGSVPTTRTITLSNDTWSMPDGPLTVVTHYNASNVPAGLTPVVTKAGAVLTVSFTGNAAPHTVGQNTTNTQLTFTNAALTLGNAAGVTGLNGTNLSVTFVDAITTFTSAAPPNGSTSIAYTHNFTVDGSPASTFALQSGTLPTGLTLGAGGALTGTPTATGMFTFTVRATNGVGTGFFDQIYTVNITAGTPPTMFTSAAPPSGLPATAYTHTFVANGNPVPNSYTIFAGALPGGLTLNAATGVLSGTPAANGIFNFTVRANNGVGTFDQAYSISVGDGTTAFTSAPPANGNLSTAYTHTFTGNGSPLANNFTVVSGALPTGLTLNAGTGVLSGTPTALGTFNFTVRADNGFGNVDQAYSIVIDPANIAPTAFTSGAPPTTGVVGTVYNHTFAANGAPTPFYTVSSGALPPGLTLNPITGILTGTPTALGSYPLVIRAVNIAGGTNSTPFTITVSATPPPTPPVVTPPPAPAPPSAPTAFALGQSPISISSSVGLPYALPIIANGNPAPTYSVVGGSLPPGVTMTPDGVLSGTPTQEGDYTFTVRAGNSQGGSNATFVMRVGPPRPVITSLSQDNGSLGDRVVLTGYNFTGATEVLIGGTPATRFSIDNNNQITATVGNGSTGPITVRTQHGTASSPTFTYNAPAVPEIRSLSTPTVVTGPANYPIVINGTNLSPFGGFSVEPADRPGFRLPVEIVSINGTQATLMLPIASRLPGVNRLVFTVGNNVVTTTFAVVQGPAPYITAVSVPSTVASAQPFTTRLTGGNYFTNGFASLTVNGQLAVGRVIDQTQAVVEIPRDLNIIGSDVKVRLTNYDRQFTEATVRVVSLPGPIITSVTPNWVNSTTQNLILHGNNYLPGAKVRLQNRDVPVIALSPSEITVRVPENFPRPSLTEEAWVIEVENPDTQNYIYRISTTTLQPFSQPSNNNCATCPAPAMPELIAASPAQVFTGPDDYTVTVTGRNIPASASFRVEPVLGQGSYPAVVEAISPERALLRLPAESRKIGPQRIVMNAGRNAVSTGFSIIPGTRPLITSLSVPSTTANGKAFTTHVRGSGFYTQPPAALTSDGRFLKSQVLSNSDAVVEIPADMNVAGPALRVRLTNADGQYDETSLLTDAADPLSIQSVQPVRFTDNTIEYLVRGRGFRPDSRVTIGGRDVRILQTQPSEMIVEYPRNSPNTPSKAGESTALQVRNTDGQCASYCMDFPLFVPPSVGTTGSSKGIGTETASQKALQAESAASKNLSGTTDELSIFPNPTEQTATVEILVEKQGTMRLSVKDMLGRTVLSLPEERAPRGTFSKTLSLETLPQGVYVLEILQGGERKTVKFVKQR